MTGNVTDAHRVYLEYAVKINVDEIAVFAHRSTLPVRKVVETKLTLPVVGPGALLCICRSRHIPWSAYLHAAHTVSRSPPILPELRYDTEKDPDKSFSSFLKSAETI